MKVPMLPTAGALIADEERAGRYLRVASHPEFGRIVLSIWQDDACLATLRLDRAAVGELIAGLARALAADVQDRAPRRTRAAARRIAG